MTKTLRYNIFIIYIMYMSIVCKILVWLGISRKIYHRPIECFIPIPLPLTKLINRKNIKI